MVKVFTLSSDAIDCSCLQDDGSLAIGAPGYRAWTGAGFVYNGSGMSPVTVASGDSLVSYGGMSVGQARVTNPDKPGTNAVQVLHAALNSLML